MSRLAVLAIAAAVSLPACAAEGGAVEELGQTTQAITNGEHDHDDHAVVALLAEGETFCTGTLIAPRVVLTAAHCVLPTPPEAVFFGHDPRAGGGATIRVVRATAHPGYRESSLRNDIALVALERDADVAPVPIARPGTVLAKDQPLRLVGFGLDAPGTLAFAKRSGATSIAELFEGEFRFRARPSQTCRGDSGGPAFASIDGREVVVGVTSSGDAECRTYGRDVRVDRHAAFVDAFVAEASAIDVAADGAGCSSAPGNAARADAALVLGLAAVVRALRLRAGARSAATRAGDRSRSGRPRR